MIPMTLTIHPDSAALRQAFIRKFTMPWEEFQVTHKDWIDGLAAKNHTVTYGELYLWDLMDHRAISFATALDFLRSMSGDVCITSERESNGGHHAFEIDGAEYTEVVIRGSAAELADLIEYEWYEPYRLDALGMYLTHTVLPADLYVFDESMERLLVFTHETDFWELEDEQPMKCAASRFCMMYGFDLPPAADYGAIRSLLLSEPAPDSSLSVELSLSCSKFFRRFTVTKQAKEDGAGYGYFFDFDEGTVYASLEEAEEAAVFGGLSLTEIAGMEDARFDLIAVDGSRP